MASSVDRLERILDKVENGDGLLPALLKDESTKKHFDATLASSAPPPRTCRRSRRTSATARACCRC